MCDLFPEYPTEVALCRLLRIDESSLNHERTLAMRHAAKMWNEAGNPVSQFALSMVLRKVLRDFKDNFLDYPPSLPYILRALKRRTYRLGSINSPHGQP
jgi:hypothetical protein